MRARTIVMRHSRPAARAPFRLTLWAALLGTLSLPGHAQQLLAASTFNEEFLGIGGDQPLADLSLFALGNRVMPGSYLVDVALNGRSVGQADVRFVEKEAKADAVPCITSRLLDGWGVNVAVFPALANAAADEACVDLASVIPEASFTYNGGKQRLFVSIPQAAMKRSARGAVEPGKWDKGITAGMIDYQINAARYSGNKYRNDTGVAIAPRNVFDSGTSTETSAALERNTLFAGLRAGFNEGDWRFRHYSTYNRGLDGAGHWQGVSTYARRDLASINGQLTFGDGNTPGNFFDSLPFRGVQLASDEAMLPDSQQGYAPTIRGVAQTNARVTVRQNGYVIYSTFVAPGPFVIDDLYPTVSNGDLEITIAEADGRQTKYVQAFSAVPTLLREGTWRYSATTGKYRDGYGSNTVAVAADGQSTSQPIFLQATLARGLGNEFTLYGGFLAANMYRSLLAGVGKNLRDLGAVSLDVSAAHTIDRTHPDNDRSYDGQSLRFLYSKAFLTSGTTFRMAGYRYSTSGFRTFQEAAQMQELRSADSLESRRNEVRFEMSQQLGDVGSVFASARQQSFWGTTAKDRLIQIGYSGSYKQFNFSIFYSHTTRATSTPLRQLMFTMSIPLGSSGANAQYGATRDTTGRVNHQASVYGSALDDNRLTYNVTAANANQGDGGSNSASASYLSRIGRLDIGHAHGTGFGQSTLGMTGGMLFHGGAMTLTQPLGETVALVQVPKAGGVGFQSEPGISTDAAGNAVIPGITPYRVNRVAIRTGDLGDTVEVRNAAMDVVPTRGAVVLAKFEASVGYRLLMTLTDRSGRILPLGAKIEDSAGQEVGVVGPEGLAFVTGAAESGRLTVRWGRGDSDQCAVPYALVAEKEPPPIRELDGRCEAVPSIPASGDVRPERIK